MAFLLNLALQNYTITWDYNLPTLRIIIHHDAVSSSTLPKQHF